MHCITNAYDVIRIINQLMRLLGHKAAISFGSVFDVSGIAEVSMHHGKVQSHYAESATAQSNIVALSVLVVHLQYYQVVNILVKCCAHVWTPTIAVNISVTSEQVTETRHVVHAG